MRRALLAVLMAAGTMLVGAAPAEAGGPTSILLTNPGESRAAAVYYTDPRYAELEELLYGESAPTRQVGGDPAPEGATQLNVTWLAHDVSVWRTDRLILDGSGRAWITSDAPSWTALADGHRIRAIAASLGVVGTGPSPIDKADVAAAVPPETGSGPDPAPVIQQETRWFTLTGWRWAVPGLVLGVLAAAVGRARRTGSAPPRQELVDGQPERVTAPG